MTSFASLKIQNLEQKTTSQTSTKTMDAFRNLLAYFNASNPSLNTLQECSSAAGDQGDNSRPHQGEEVVEKIIIILTFYNNTTQPRNAKTYKDTV